MKIFTKGTCTFDGKDYNIFAISNSSSQIEIFLTDLYAHIESSYKFDGKDEYSFNNNQSKEVWKFIKNGISKCTTKNVSLVPIKGIGTVKRYSVNKGKSDWSIDKYDGQFCGVEASGVTNDGKQITVYLEKCDTFDVQEIPYIKLTNLLDATVKNSLQTEFEGIDSFEETIPVRSLAEIGLEKDITWLNNKKYYIVNDEIQAEYIFKYLENYNGIISYDTETTGLCMNMFGEVGSERKKFIDAENERLKLEGKPVYKVDKLVGIIFCVERDVSYYFPCGNRKFKNIYSDINNETTKSVAQNILARYTVGDLRESKTSMANYIRNTPMDEWSSDVILMERVRDILENKWIGAHHGSFEYKVGMMYSIDTNLKDDSMLLHQLLFKFRSTTSNRGEPSNLKYLTKVEFGVDQLDLKDFFVTYAEDSSGLARQDGKRKKKSSNIDFSYMDYDGAKAYAPADGDFTLGLIIKYKKELNTPELKSQEYLYSVEVLVSCAIGYMEYYGHRLDENKIEATKINTYSDMLLIEKKIRDFINANTVEELAGFDKIKGLQEELSNIEKDMTSTSLTEDEKILTQEKYEKVLKELDEKNMEVRNMIDTSENLLNLGSPQQVCELFYEKLGIPAADKDKPSVAKRAIKPLSQAKDENNKLKYPVVKLYMDWKNCNTLLTKFFDNLPAYSYPGGFIFSSYGQISTATGRMSCSKPNAQQYPHSVTKMVIPRHGCVFADADYSQIEYRTLTAMAKEPALMDKFKDPDMDYHTTMASLMYDVPYANVTGSMRSEAKTFNFGIPYGMGLKKLAFQLKGSESPEAIADAQIKYDLYFKEQPNVKKFFDDVKEGARIYGYTRTKWGRRRYFSFTDDSGKLDTRKMGAALRQAGNACIQGCLSPDTRIQTKDYGIVPIEKVVGQHLLVWSGDKWTNGDITYSGKKQKCIVKFSTGQEFVCSPIHKFLVKSHKGNDRFVECKDLRGSINSTNPHRVVINRKYEPSDYKYSSDIARELYKSKAFNSNNVYIDDVGDSFKAGIVLGRLASDGNITNTKYGHSIRQIISEHELNIAPKLISYMENLNCVYKENSLRENRNEIVNHLNVYSKSLVSEITDLDIKHQMHDNIFMDTELLRGFLSGFFDGDGGISGKTIALTFGIQYDFESMCRDIQKALLFFGIRSRYKKYPDRYKIIIKTYDNQKFLDLIGFINEDKQNKARELKCVKDEHIFGSVLVVESVEITDEYIDMYDVCNTDDGYYVADGIITHNTAADIFKIGVARNFLFIRDNNLFGKYFITNMVHDEQLVEISCELNVKTILANLIKAMELHIDGFPPLFVGAGIGESWDEAKGKMAEIHPILGKTFVKEVEDSNDGLYATDPMTPEEVYIYFNKRNYEFREQKILDYVLDESNYGQALHPVIGSLLGLQFDYGVSKELKERFTKDGEGISYTKEEKEKAELQSPMERLKRFIEAHNLDIDVNNFVSTSVTNIDEEILDEYVDEMDEDLDDLDIDMTDDGETGISAAFKLIDESTEYFGCSLKDLIKTMGIVVSHKQRIVGINWNGLTFASQQRLSKYLSNHLCNQSDSGAYRVLLLNNVGQLMPKPDQQQMFINNISENYLSDNVEIS